MSDDTFGAGGAIGRLRSLARQPFAMLLAYGIMAGAAFSIAKLAMGAGVRPIAYTFWQIAGAAAVLLVIGLLRGDRFPMSRRHLAFYAVCGLPGLALPYGNIYITVEHLPAGVMALILATIPIFTYGLAVVLGVERIARRRLAGVACGCLGALLILAPRASLPTPDLTFWALLAFLSPVLFAASHMVVFKYRPPDTGTLPLTVGMLIAGSAALLPAAWLSGEFYIPRFGDPGIAELVIAIQICTAAINYLLFFEIIRRAGPVFFAQVGYVLTLTGMMWAALIFGESYSFWIWSATGLVFAGIALSRAHDGVGGKIAGRDRSVYSGNYRSPSKFSKAGSKAGALTGQNGR